MLERETSIATKRHLARALALLASREASRVAVKDAGAAELFATVLEKEKASEAALGLLNLAPTTADRRSLLKRGVVKQLVGLLEDFEAGYYAAGALANITAGSPEAAGEATAAGAVPILLTMLRDVDADGGAYGEGAPASSREVLEWVAGALGNLAEFGGASVRTGVTEGGALEPLVRLLVRAPGVGQELAAFVLGALAEQCEREVRLQLAEAEGVAEALHEVVGRLPEGRLRVRTQGLLRLAK